MYAYETLSSFHLKVQKEFRKNKVKILEGKVKVKHSCVLYCVHFVTDELVSSKKMGKTSMCMYFCSEPSEPHTVSLSLLCSFHLMFSPSLDFRPRPLSNLLSLL